LSAPSPIAERVLAILASVFFVIAFALAALLPPTTSLFRVAALLDDHIMPRLQTLVREDVSEWAWRSLFVPVLQRPGWLLPLAIGLVLAGAALSVSSRRRARHAPSNRP
jgi:hypothetical protein